VVRDARCAMSDERTYCEFAAHSQSARCYVPVTAELQLFHPTNSCSRLPFRVTADSALEP